MLLFIKGSNSNSGMGGSRQIVNSMAHGLGARRMRIEKTDVHLELGCAALMHMVCGHADAALVENASDETSVSRD